MRIHNKSKYDKSLEDCAQPVKMSIEQGISDTLGRKAYNTTS